MNPPKTENQNPRRGRRGYISPAHEEADRLLAELGDVRNILAQNEEDMAAELAGYKATSAHWQRLEHILKNNREMEKSLDKALLKFAKKQRDVLFDGGDKVDLPHGVLLFSVKKWVRKARDVTVDLLKKLGFLSAVKVVESVNWDEIDAWPEERLILIGTERETKEIYAYEVKES